MSINMLLKENYQKYFPPRNGGIRLVMKIDPVNCPSIGQFYLGPTCPKTHWAYMKRVYSIHANELKYCTLVQSVFHRTCHDKPHYLDLLHKRKHQLSKMLSPCMTGLRTNTGSYQKAMTNPVFKKKLIKSGQSTGKMKTGCLLF